MMGHFLLVRIFFDYAGKDAWVGILIAFLIGIPVFIATGKLNEKLYGNTIIEKFLQWFGPWLGRLLTIPLILYFFFLSTITLYGLVDFAKSFFLIETPVWAVASAFAVAVLYMTHLGIEVITRVSEWILVWIFIAGLVVFIALIGEKDYTLLLPILENGLSPVIPVIFLNLATFGEMVVMLMINVKKDHEKAISYTKIYLLALVINFFIYLGTATGPIAIFGEELTGKFNYPLQSTVRMISLGFIERLDSFGLTLVVTGSFVRLGIFHYAASIAVAQWLNLKKYHFFNWIIGGILIFASLYAFKSFKQFYDVLKNYYPYGTFFAVFLILLWLAVTIISKFQRKEVKK